jgi:mRNA interferase MazF
VCLIASNVSLSRAPGNVALSKGAANLPKASVVNVSQVLTVNKAELVERIGKLPAAVIDAILDGLQLLFDRV